MKRALLMGLSVSLLNFISAGVQAQQDPFAGACCRKFDCFIAPNRGACHQFGGVFFGPGTICNSPEVNCIDPQPRGACCILYKSGQRECRNLTRQGCSDFFDPATMNTVSWIGDGEFCAQIDFCGTIPPRNMVDIAEEENIPFRTSYNEDHNTVTLNWQKTLPYGADNFYIGRSRDGQEYKIIGIVPMQIASAGYIDYYPLPEAHYKIFYWEQSKLYSSRESSVFTIAKGKIQVLPNPTSGKLRILIANMQTFDTEVSIIDVTGRLVLSKKINKGSHPEIDISSLTNGTFVIQARQNGTTYTEKIQKN